MEEYDFFKAIRAGTLGGAYLLHGQEEYSKEQAVRQCTALLDPSVRDMNLTRLKSPDAPQVTEACDALPFFDRLRVVILQELSTEEGAKLIPYVEKLPPEVLLLIWVRGAAVKTGALFKAMQKLDRAVEFAPYDQERAMAFAAKRVQTAGASLSRAGARRMVEMVGTDLASLSGAAAKAAAYVGENGQVGPEALAECITPNLEYSVFKLLDMLVAGEKKAGLTMLLSMLKSGESALGLASFLEGRVRQMLQARQLLDAGSPEDAAAKTLGGSPYAAKMTVKNAKKLDQTRLSAALLELAEVDGKLKSGRMRDGDALLLAAIRNF